MAGNPITVGVLALQGAFAEHLTLLRQAATILPQTQSPTPTIFTFTEVRTPTDLSACDALIIPGGESTSISLIAERTGLLDPLRTFVKLDRKPVWGTCAGLILLAESANRTKATGQALIGGLDVRVQRNYFGRQVESFEADLELGFLGDVSTAGAGAAEVIGTPKFHSVFIRAPVVEAVLSSSGSSTSTTPAAPSPVAQQGTDDASHISAPQLKATSALVEVLGRLPGRARALPPQEGKTAAQLGEEGDIVAVRQGNVFGTAFHPELTGDARIHAWWLGEVVKAMRAGV